MASLVYLRSRFGVSLSGCFCGQRVNVIRNMFPEAFLFFYLASTCYLLSHLCELICSHDSCTDRDDSWSRAESIGGDPVSRELAARGSRVVFRYRVIWCFGTSYEHVGGRGSHTNTPNYQER